MAEYNTPFAGSSKGRESVSTTCVTLKSDDARLKIGLYDDSFSVEFSLPDVDVNGQKTWPRDNSHRISFILTPERAAAMYDSIQNELIPAMKEGRPLSTGYPTNNEGSRIVDMAFDPNGNLMLRGFANVDSETRRAGIAVYFPFNKIVNVTDYNKDTGSFNAREVHANFYLFIWLLKAYLIGTMMCAPHSIKKDWYFKQEIKRVNDMAVKLGVPVNQSGGGNHSYPFAVNQAQSQTFTYPQAPSVGPTEASSMDELFEDGV
jgi:hypothetical protein